MHDTNTAAVEIEEQPKARRSNVYGMKRKYQRKPRPGELVKRGHRAQATVGHVSLKQYAMTTDEGKAWLKRKRSS